MKIFLTYIVLTVNFLSLSQTQFNSKIDSLEYTTNVVSICRSANVLEECELCSQCGDIFFWEIVQGKDSVITLLMDKISDTTKTAAPNNFAGINYSVGDIALLALQEIIHDIPTLDLAGTEFSSSEGYGVFWKHLNTNTENRVLFVKALENWYNTNMEELTWVNSNVFEICDCSGPHPNGGHYVLKKD